jgi:molybdate transport system substrate-binding protein
MPRQILTSLAFALALAVPYAGATAQAPAIAAAANIKFALAEIEQAFRRDTGLSVRIAYGSSGNLTQQIENGAPFELFLSADEQHVERLASRGLTRDRGALYAVGRLVLFVPRGSPLAADASLADLKAAIADGRLARFAIANPEHAPYGRAAQQALERARLWEAIRPRLVFGENVSQAMQFAAGGDTQGGLVPLALAKSPEIDKLGSWALLPESMHDPLRQRMVLLKPAGPVAMRFYDYLQGKPARDILVRHGYTLPGASP